MLVNSEKKHLHDLAKCHIACFPHSLSSKTGSAYIEKMLEWFLVNPNRFMYHIELDNKIVGYVGGFAPQEYGEGSSTGMLQYAFKKGVIGLLKKPWLLFHKELGQRQSFIWFNIKKKITGSKQNLSKPPAGKPVKPTHIGWVVSGVLPEYRGRGIAQLLMEELDNRARGYNRNELILSVRKDNLRGIKAFEKSGWKIWKEDTDAYVMQKLI